MICELKCEGCEKHLGFVEGDEGSDPTTYPDAYCDDCHKALFALTTGLGYFRQSFIPE